MTLHDTLRLAALLPLAVSVPAISAQELVPDAYAVAPVGVNFLTAAVTVNKGDVAFDPSLPVEDASATIRLAGVGYGRTLDVAGRSAQIAVFLPYVDGDLQGLYLGQPQRVSRSGLGDPSLRVGINLYGAPAMRLKEFAAYRRRTNFGASVTVQAPLGQYDSNKVVNLGTHRWAFKPEVGVEHTHHRWTFQGYVGAWLFTDNTSFLGTGTRSQAPILSTQFHGLYTFRPRWWVGIDANFWTGGRITVNGRQDLELQRNSRLGTTVAMPLTRRQTLRVSYSFGAVTRIGGDFQSIGMSYGYTWGGGV